MISPMPNFTLSESDLQFSAIRASGPGGQHVNKVSTAVELRFDIKSSSLPDNIKSELMRLSDRRISKDGIIVLKAQRYRSQEKNRQDAIDRLKALIEKAATPAKKRIATKPGKAAKERRIREKKKTGEKKSMRGFVRAED
ncbi:MAG: alternative ribosome rescue aminoacyl-tRNA hydrolase ArfB [Proteobacteria bacterium]|nr:alternative ribosome rescue aminoacyl-tRNA hydrolase ArfB [Pseudomonadota bacterium]MDA0929349.1 alternative ribosome rescue aminoacyl-tRNA hydrolase ArfB [Pseudomonadota bacterium]